MKKIQRLRKFVNESKRTQYIRMFSDRNKDHRRIKIMSPNERFLKKLMKKFSGGERWDGWSVVYRFPLDK